MTSKEKADASAKTMQSIFGKPVVERNEYSQVEQCDAVHFFIDESTEEAIESGKKFTQSMAKR